MDNSAFHSQKRRAIFLALICFFCMTIAPVLRAFSSEEITCDPSRLADCYDEGVHLYNAKDFEQAKQMFEKIVSIDAKYKKAAAYLKKCYNNMAENLIAEKTTLQSQIKETTAEESPKPLLPIQQEKAVEPQKPDETSPPEPMAYRIGVGDVLEIGVWRNIDLDKMVIVRPDGIISYPLVGDIQAGGLTLTQLDQILTEKLREYVISPQVSVAIQRFGGKKIILLGEVKAPGVYAPQGETNIIDVIAMAGGFTNDALKHASFLVRGNLKQQPEVYRLNLARILKGDLSQNITLASNDIVYVPKKFMANFNYVLNQLTPLLSNTLLGTSIKQGVTQ